MSTDIHNDILYSDAVTARIVELADRSLEEAYDEEADTEYMQLLTFQTQVIKRFSLPAWKRGLSFVARRYWDDYAADNARDLFGEVTETDYFNHKKFAADLTERFVSFRLDGTEYWTDGQS